jgi:hypothetical protein
MTVCLPIARSLTSQTSKHSLDVITIAAPQHIFRSPDILASPRGLYSSVMAISIPFMSLPRLSVIR